MEALRKTPDSAPKQTHETELLALRKFIEDDSQQAVLVEHLTNLRARMHERKELEVNIGNGPIQSEESRKFYAAVEAEIASIEAILAQFREDREQLTQTLHALYGTDSTT